MTLDTLRPLAMRLVDPFVAGARRFGITPDAVSVLAFVLAAGAGIAFYLGGVARSWYFVGAVLVAFNGWLDLVDGELARETGAASRAGDLLDHVLDRYADVTIVAGLAAGIEGYALGFAAVTGVLMTSYLGTQAQAVGLDRVYAGVLGRADRLVLVGVTATVAAVRPVIAGVGVVAALLAVFAAVGHLTAAQRFYGAWRALD